MWYMPVILTRRPWRQKDQEFEFVSAITFKELQSGLASVKLRLKNKQQ